MKHSSVIIVARRNRRELLRLGPAFNIVRCWSGTFDYVYGTWWRCRDCGYWREKAPEVKP